MFVSISQIHKSLLDHGVHGGHIIRDEFPEFGESALYCVTEVHSKVSIDALVSAFRMALGGDV